MERLALSLSLSRTISPTKGRSSLFLGSSSLYIFVVGTDTTYFALDLNSLFTMHDREASQRQMRLGVISFCSFINDCNLLGRWGDEEHSTRLSSPSRVCTRVPIQVPLDPSYLHLWNFFFAPLVLDSLVWVRFRVWHSSTKRFYLSFPPQSVERLDTGMRSKITRRPDLGQFTFPFRSQKSSRSEMRIFATDNDEWEFSWLIPTVSLFPITRKRLLRSSRIYLGGLGKLCFFPQSPPIFTATATAIYWPDKIGTLEILSNTR